MSFKNDRLIIKELAKKVAEIAALPIQEKRLKDWKAINSLKPNRPMFMIDQIPWHELNYNDELSLRCQDDYAKSIEERLRKKIYKYNHMQDDEVQRNYFEVQKKVKNSGYGLSVDEERIDTLDNKDVSSHLFHDQLSTEKDLEKIKDPIIEYDEEGTDANVQYANDLLDGILDVKLTGHTIGLHIWDRISEFRGVSPILYDVIDKPDFIHKIIKRFKDHVMMELDRYEELGLLEPAQDLIHCAGAYTDELPTKDLNKHKPTAKDSWTFGMAQLFSSVSPAMQNEFEIEHMLPCYKRFGLVNYGCCEPLHNKIDIIRQIDNVKMISVSPWADEEISAEAMGSDYIFLRKPNPAMVVGDHYSDEKIYKYLTDTIKTCEKHGAIPEFILKDISTVGYNYKNLWNWAKVARDICGN